MEAGLSSGDEICSKSWKAAQLQGQASVRAQRASELLLSSRTSAIVVDKSVTRNESFLSGRGLDKPMRQLSENRLELGFFTGAMKC